MNPVDTLVLTLRAKGIVLRVEGEDGNELAVRAPKGAMTADLAAQLREHKAALLSYLRQAQAQQRVSLATIPVAPGAARTQLSDGQRRLWFLHRLEGPSPTYNMPLAVRIRGPLDSDAVDRALKALAQRHETLRTRFVSDQDTVAAVIDATPTIELQKQVADGHEPLDVQVAAAVAMAASVTFSLSEEHLFKAWLVELSDQSHLLLVTLHHIIADGWSLSNLIREFTELYASDASSLPALPIQYADYVAWQHGERNPQSRDASLQWWCDRLAGAPELIALPLDHPRPAVTKYRGQCLKHRLPPELTERVRSLAKSSDLTPYMVMLAAFAILLQRHADSREAADLVIGTTAANRPRPELEPLIGLFINMLALRLTVDGSEPAQALLTQVKQASLQAQGHQDVAFEQVVERLNPRRSLAHAPVFQVTFDVQNAPQAELRLGDLVLEPIEPEVTTSKFDLGLSIETDADGEFARWTWNPALFEHATIEQLAGQYQTLLAHLAEHPDWPVGRLPLLLGPQRQALAHAQRASTRPLADTSWLVEFEQRVRERPAHPAVSFAGQTLSYKNLHHRALALAAVLTQHGVTVEDKVAVLMERGIDLVVALLAVQYAGAAYVPLDPGYPAQRLAWVFEDATPAAVLTQRALSSSIPAGTATVIEVDTLDLQAVDARALAQQVLPDPATLAYVIFTSGSTGRPKGVQIEHRALLNFLLSMAREPGLSSEDVLLAVTTVSFDIAGLELYLPLMVGAHLVLSDRDTAVNGQALQRLLSEQGVTCMQATPSTWRLLVDSGWADAQGLRVLCGGEALTQDLTHRLQAVGAEVWNLYGPTETTIWSAARRIVEPRAAQATGNEPVGAGIDNTQLYVLDEFGELLPSGMAGELWIGGLGLARGYLNRPGQTAERYRPDPFGAAPGGRLYGTGDLVRARPDGTFEFLGRLDGQVKLRGYRIELGEIESALRRQPDVRQAVVLALGEDAIDRQLVAYLETGDRVGPAVSALRAALRLALPSYMVPAQFVMLPKLPLTPNGKIDRKALPQPTTGEPVSEPVTIAPRTTLERRIGEVWCAALKRTSIDIDSNFFDAGGHSLLLAHVHQQLEQTLARSIELIVLFQHPTIRSLAKHIESLDSAAGGVMRPRAHQRQAHNAIAIIGMACCLPGAPDLETFWQTLVSGQSGIRLFDKEQLRAAGIPAADYDAPSYVPAHGAIEDIECFDANLFGYRPAQARLIDPQQRLFLQTAWHALEHAGYGDTERNPSVGVFAGCGQNDYLIDHVLPHLQNADGVSTYEAILGAEKDFIATRVSYALNLTGPSVNVQTACSTSLVAVHMACQSLLAGECEMALAGGVALRVPQANGHHFQEGMITSPDGHCRAFDARAKGTVWGSGTGAVLLKPLQQAMNDGDTIHAVILGSAINNDGSNKVGFTAPSVDGQAQVIAQAQAAAGVAPTDIGFVETHGTATALGDLIETAALKKVWGTSPPLTCALGAVKSQIGHLNSAAGIAGLIKTALSVQHGQVPGHADFDSPNPALGLTDSPFFVNQQTRGWPRASGRRVAGVSSFGIGGTNAHVVLAAPPRITQAGPDDGPVVLALSANSDASLMQLRDRWLTDLATQTAPVRDMSATLALGRRALSHRIAVVTHDKAEAKTLLAAAAPHRRDRPARLVWLFAGQGSQVAGMGQTLYTRWPVFKEAIDECADGLRPLMGHDLRDIFDPERSNGCALLTQIDQTWLTQPALFALEYAQAKLWQSWGIEPSAMLGHSLGEYVAACLAGVFDLPSALKLVAARGQLIWQQTPGAMLAVAMSRAEVVALLSGPMGDGVDLAAVNGPRACVVAGSQQAIAAIQAQLLASNQPCKRLSTSHAFHSRMLAAAQAQFAPVVAAIELRPPQIPLVSNVSGTWLRDDEAVDPAYWVRHMGASVEFAQGIATLITEADVIALEVGPGQVLTNLTRQQCPTGTVVIASGESTTSVLKAAARLWCEQASIDLGRCLDDSGPAIRRVPLPLYPFERQRHWLEAAAVQPSGPQGRQRIDDWFYLPHWEPVVRPNRADVAPSKTWYLDGDTGDWLKGLPQALASGGNPVVELTIESETQLQQTMAGFAAAQDIGVVVLADPTGKRSTFERLLGWARTWQARRLGQPLDITVVTPPVHPALGSESLAVNQATLRAAVLVIAQEFASIRIRCIDVESNHRGPAAPVLEAVREAIFDAGHSPFIALRGARRFQPAYKAVALPANPANHPLRPNGVYLITGGLGRMGLTIARALIERVGATVVLTSRTGAHASGPQQALQEQFAEKVIVKAVDASDAVAMTDLIAQIRREHGALHGVFHAAGSPGQWQSITDSGPTADETLLRAKLGGAEVLAQALKLVMPDFVVLMSSVAAELGGLGYARYAAANAALDALAHQQSLETATPWLSIGWDAWRHDASGDSDWISPEEGVEALWRVLAAMPCPRVLVSTTPLPLRVDRWVNQMGQRQAPAAAIAGEPGTRVTDPTLTPTQRAVTEIWQALLGYASIGLDDDYFELGGDSMLAIRIVESMQIQFQRPIAMTALLEHPSVRQMARALDADAGLNAAVRVPLNGVSGDKILYWVPGTGGSVVYLTELGRELGKLGWSCMGLQATGLDGQSAPLDSIEAIAEQNVEALLTHQPQGPYTLGGHSLGSWIAYEMARQLTALGHEVSQVIVLDTAAPGPRSNDQFRDWRSEEWVVSIAKNIGQVWDIDFGITAESLSDLDWPAQVARLHAVTVKHGIFSSQSDPQLVRGLVEVFRTQSLIQYQPVPHAVSPVLLLRASEPMAEFLQGIPQALINDPTWGWHRFSQGEVTVVNVPGNHLNMVNGQHAVALATRIQAHLGTPHEVTS